jgi:hypothetical protein
MPRLGDYVGQLVSEITIARTQADLEAVRVAELYASHPLLRHMTVPRFTLPKVELEVPVLIDSMEEPRAGESPRGGIDVSKFRREFDRVMATEFRRERIRLSASQRRRIRGALDREVSEFSRPTETAIDVGHLAKKMTRVLMTKLGERTGGSRPLDPERATAIGAEIRSRATLQFLKGRSAPPRLGVLVTHSELRDAGTPEGSSHVFG